MQGRRLAAAWKGFRKNDREFFAAVDLFAMRFRGVNLIGQPHHIGSDQLRNLPGGCHGIASKIQQFDLIHVFRHTVGNQIADFVKAVSEFFGGFLRGRVGGNHGGGFRVLVSCEASGGRLRSADGTDRRIEAGIAGENVLQHVAVNTVDRV